MHPHPERVTDPLFQEHPAFFDARDRVQVKYEMLRRVAHEGLPVATAAQRFGMSRPAFYQAQAALAAGGIPALVPAKPGPRRAHKVTDAVLAYCETLLAVDPHLGGRRLAAAVTEQFGIRVHPRSLERRLTRQKKGR